MCSCLPLPSRQCAITHSSPDIQRAITSRCRLRSESTSILLKTNETGRSSVSGDAAWAWNALAASARTCTSDTAFRRHLQTAPLEVSRKRPMFGADLQLSYCLAIRLSQLHCSVPQHFPAKCHCNLRIKIIIIIIIIYYDRYLSSSSSSSGSLAPPGVKLFTQQSTRCQRLPAIRPAEERPML